MRYVSVSQLLLGTCLLLSTAPLCGGEQPKWELTAPLKKAVQEREQQWIVAKRSLAEARARLALAEGERDVAIAQLRQAVAGYQEEVQWIKDHANTFCDPRERLTQALWDLAKTRVWLAEVEEDIATQVTQWKTIVGFHEQQLERLQRLEQLGVATSAEVSTVQEARDKVRERLLAAQQKFAEITKQGEISK